MDTVANARGKTFRQIACSPWRPVTYDDKKDTALTVEQVQVHNQTGRNLRCWK